jgi:methionyl-tRNA formyltransferase
MRIGIISNSDQFIPLAYTLANNRLQVCIFFAPPEDPYIRQKVHAFAQSTHLPLMHGNENTDVYNWLEAQQPNIVFIYGYRHLLDVTQFARRGVTVFNIHPGPLPAFRGPVPVFWQLKLGVSHLCLSIHVLSQRFDDGPVVWTKIIPDQPHYNYALVHHIFSQLAIEGVYFILDMLSRQLPLPTLTDPSGLAPAYHKRPVLADVQIDWEQMPAAMICNLVRACNPWNKGAITFLDGQEVKVMDALCTGLHTTLPAGTVNPQGTQLLIATADEQFLQVNTLLTNDIFIPTYQAGYYGIKQGLRLG